MTIPSVLRTDVGTLLRLIGLIVLALAASAPHGALVPAPAVHILDLLRRTGLNQEDQDQQTAGYYEGLLNQGGQTGGIAGLLTSGKQFDAEDWSRPDRRHRGDFLYYDLKPNSRITDYLDPRHTRITNQFGMADREYTRVKPAGVRRLIVLGDSVSRGAGVPFGTAYEALLEDALNLERPGGYEILNLAVGGYRMTQLVEVAHERAAGFEPDVLLVAITDLGVFRGWSDHLATLVQEGVDLKYDYLKDLVRHAGVQQGDSVSMIRSKLARHRLPVIKWALGEIHAAATAVDAHTVVLLVPTVSDFDTMERQFQGVREVIGELKLPLIDLLDTFRSHDPADVRVAENDRHPNQRGHALLFERLIRDIHADSSLGRMILSTP